MSLAAAPARAESYPTRPVELIVPFAAGGGSDLLARLLAEGLAKRLGQPFVVINRPGANTDIGMLSVARAKPDGHTLLIASVGLAANPSLYTRLNFDPIAELAPIALLANSPTVLVVPPALPVTSLREFHRLCQGASGRAQLRLLWRRQRPASRHRAVHGGDRHEARAHRLRGADRRPSPP